MYGEIVTATTSDHLRLHGFFRRATKPPRVSLNKGSIDSVVLIHGLAGNFYGSRLLNHVAETLLELGVSVVQINTRGHEMVNTLSWSGRARSVGAALEDVDHCRYDLHAWVDFLKKAGFSNIMLCGHSLGAIKSLYTQAHQPHPAVKSIIALSATRLSYQKLIESSDGDAFRQTIEECKRLLVEGQGRSPIEVPVPFRTWMTPQCYLDKYGPAERFNWLRFIDHVNIPTLMLFGEKELAENPAFTGLTEELEDLKRRWNSLTIDIIPGADHFYTSRFADADEPIVRWLTN